MNEHTLKVLGKLEAIVRNYQGLCHETKELYATGKKTPLSLYLALKFLYQELKKIEHDLNE